MWTGVVFAYILCRHTTTKFALPIIFFMSAYKKLIVRKQNGVLWYFCISKQGWSRNVLYLHLHEIHKFLVFPSNTSYEVSINTAIMFNSIFTDIYFSPQVANE